jgi:VCBS repeat-containing protein
MYLDGYFNYRNKNTHTDIFKIVISVQYTEQVTVTSVQYTEQVIAEWRHNLQIYTFTYHAVTS